jgi:hypothetical protein
VVDGMGIQLTQTQINALKVKANIESDRDIYSIRFDGQEITINGDWSIQRDGTPIDKNIITAIEAYCTVNNIEWEYNATYSAWCD